MNQAYEPTANLSNNRFLRQAWQFTVGLLLAISTGGLLLAAALSLGLADPPRAGPLRWSAVSADSWLLYRDVGGNRLYIPDMTARGLPFTLEITAASGAAALSAWGLWVETSQNSYLLLVGRDGYISTGAARDWRGFIHVRPDENTLYLHAEADGRMTFRINGELAWTGRLTPAQVVNWGWLTADEPKGFHLMDARYYAP